MANSEESSPLIPTNPAGDDTASPKQTPPAPAEKKSKSFPEETPAAYGWTVDGVPVAAGEAHMMQNRMMWDSSICSCLGRNDKFCSSDLEVCLLGSIAPCMLYGSNAERIGSAPGTYANHCLCYCGLYMLGNSMFGWNCLAPWFSYASRTAIRRKFNLEGTCEALSRSCGCADSFLEDDVQREHCETACDLATHMFCHTCALCQEARELRRRLPHPGFNAQPVLVMVPPGHQAMAREEA